MSKRLWAPWRLAYVQQAGGPDGCIFCREAAGELGSDSLVVHRGDRVLAMLNKFPYSSGHVMVAPVRHVAGFDELDVEEWLEIRSLTTGAMAGLTEIYAPDAFNVGWNLGEVAGGSVTGHVHEHVVPRWAGDTNFMPVLADVKVVPEHLLETRDRLIAAWPA